MKKKEKEEEGAPAYMAQYTALMTILLAFFITMLSMGQNRVSKYNNIGLGYFRDSFGLGINMKGGIGILPLWKSVMPHEPDVQESKDVPLDEKNLLGYLKGAFEAERMDSDTLLGTELQDYGYYVAVPSDVKFADGKANLGVNARKSLDRVGGVFYNLSGFIITVCCYDGTGAEETRQAVAAKRAAVVVRYLETKCGVPRERLHAVGFAHDRYLESAKDSNAGQILQFVVRKKYERQQT